MARQPGRWKGWWGFGGPWLSLLMVLPTLVIPVGWFLIFLQVCHFDTQNPLPKAAQTRTMDVQGKAPAPIEERGTRQFKAGKWEGAQTTTPQGKEPQKWCDPGRVIEVERHLGQPPIQFPSWAPCQNPPCQYSHLKKADISEIDQAEPWHSQEGEDKWVFENFFYGVRNGFFLEIGAIDGVVFSNTLWLARAAGWRGLLIEPSPRPYTCLVQNRKEDSICVNAAVCNSKKKLHWVDNPTMYATNGILEFMPKEIVDMFHLGKINLAELPEIACLPMMEILDRVGVDTIDYWVLDVEGAEMEVLSTVDFSRLTVNVMAVETDCSNKEKDEQVVNTLKGAGMELVFEEQCRNSFFVHKSYLPKLSAKPAQ